MLKRKGIISKMILVLVLLTLISCCFLGFTFARYTSGVTGTATVEVAKWDIAFSDGTNTLNNNFTVSFNKLSPSADPYSAGSTRSNDTGIALVAKITNSSDVSAEISFTKDTTPTVTTSATYADYTEAQVQGLFSIAYTVSKSELTSFPASATETVSLAAGETAYIYANVTWTSADTTSNGDALDTWVGENVTSVSWNIECTAVQASELPTA